MGKRLRLCPVCGHKAGIRNYPRLDGKPSWAVYCNGFGCKVNPMTIEYDTEDQARAAWNQRGKRK